jgi:hypothetical protein
MLATAATFTLDGISARPVRVEVDVHRGLPGFAIVGLPDAAVREARERVRAALVNSGFEFPLSRIVVNLAPASMRKAGPGMDLAIAAGLLRASEQLEWEGVDRVAFAGELALDGQVRPIHGALAIAEAAREAGVGALVVPAENGSEAALAGGVEVVPLGRLAELPLLAAGERAPEPMPLRLPTGPPPGGPDLADLRGQPHLRHALEVAAAAGTRCSWWVRRARASRWRRVGCPRSCRRCGRPRRWRWRGSPVSPGVSGRACLPDGRSARPTTRSGRRVDRRRFPAGSRRDHDGAPRRPVPGRAL